MEIVIASTNLHKVRELRDMLKGDFDLEVRSLHDFPDYRPLGALGLDFQNNAAEKALHAAKALKCWTLGDDSGLVVPALQENLKKVERYEGSQDSAQANRSELLHKLRLQEQLKRAAYFVCGLALASPEGELIKAVTARCEGLILHEEKGNHGFSFDPLFIKHDYDKSFGELDDSARNRISHRRKAFDKLLPTLQKELV